MLEKGAKIQPAQGKVGILLVGLGAVSTTFIAGVEAIKKKIAKPIGSLTQMGHIRLGKRTEKRNPLIKEFVPLARLEDLVFAAWDIFPDSAYEAAAKAQVLKKEDLEAVRPELEAVRPWKAVFDKNYVKRLDGPNVKTGKNKRELADQLIANGSADACVMIRELIAEPEFVNKAQAGRIDDIRPCAYWNQGCVAHIFKDTRVECQMNGATGHELEFFDFRHVLSVARKFVDHAVSV